MYPDYHQLPLLVDSPVRPDRRQIPTANDIRTRVRRARRRQEA